jgi:hypothetical protein
MSRNIFTIVMFSIVCSAMLLCANKPVWAQNDRQPHAQCEMVVGGDLGGAQYEVNTSVQQVSLTLTGYLACSRPDSIRAVQYIMTQVNLDYRTGNANAAQDQKMRSTLQYCHKVALLALSNPAKYALTFEVRLPRVSAFLQNEPRHLTLFIDDHSTAFGCGLHRNLTGLE